MIKFFRKFRQNMLAEGKTGKYLQYAIGEIILVVIGILIALQINNWNEERKRRIIEDEVIVALNSEYKAAKEDLRRKISLLNRKNEVLGTLSENCSPQHFVVSKEKMDSLINRSYALPSFNPPNATLSDLLNSGKIDVINNLELRKLLSTWIGKLEEAKRQESFQGDFLYNRYTPFIEDRIEFKYSKMQERMKMKETDSFGIDSRELLKDVKFCNLIRRAIYWNTWVEYSYKSLERDIDEIIELTREKNEGKDK